MFSSYNHKKQFPHIKRSLLCVLEQLPPIAGGAHRQGFLNAVQPHPAVKTESIPCTWPLLDAWNTDAICNKYSAYVMTTELGPLRTYILIPI
jgi:hypothetical protein